MQHNESNIVRTPKNMYEIRLIIVTGGTINTGSTSTDPPVPGPGGHDNCEVLYPSLQLAWTVERTSSSISFMLLGCQSMNPK